MDTHTFRWYGLVMEIQEVTVEPRGWLYIEEVEPAIRVQFREAEDGRLEPSGVTMENAVLSNRVLAKLPFGSIEALANMPHIAASIRKSIRSGARFRSVKHGGIVPATELKGNLFSKRPTFFSGTVTDTVAMSDAINYELTGQSNIERLAEIVSSRPTRYTDEFFKRVAAEYRSQTPSGRPGAYLAEQLGVPVSTVWRWIRTCRQKGFLPPARAGKEG